jgi:hypothetical protein
VKAYILIQTEPGTDGRLARDVAGVPGVTRVERVAGPYDVIAEADLRGVGAEAVPRIRGLDGVLRALPSTVVRGSELEAPAA